jgi:hypothetical protein
VISQGSRDLTAARPSLRNFGVLWWAVTGLGLFLALALAAFSGLLVPAGCDASEGLLQDFGTSPEELGFCDARSGWQRTLLTALPLAAAAELTLALVIVIAAISRGGERRGKISFAIRSSSLATVARLALVSGWLMIAGWFLAQVVIGLIGSYNSA